MNRLYGWINLEFVYSLGWALLHSLWQAGVIAGVLAIMLRLTRHWSSNSRYLLSVTALTCVLVCTLLTFNGYFQALQYGLAHGPTSLWSISHTAIGESSLVSKLHPFLNRYIIELMVLWSIGCCVLFTRHCGAWLYCQRLKKSLSIQAPALWQQRIQAQAKRIGLQRRIVMRLSHRIHVPCVIGHIKPVVLLPAILLTRLSAAELEMILLHELAHIRRHDYLVGLIQSLLKTLYFFNLPALWISRQVDIERENSCDDVAANTSQNRLFYAKTLTLFSELTHQGELTMALTGKHHLKHRIQRLFEPHIATRSPAQGIISCLVISACVALLSVQATATETIPTYPNISSLNDTEVQRLINDYKAAIYTDSNIPQILTMTETLPGYEALTAKEKSSFANYLEQELWANSYANLKRDEMNASMSDEQWLSARKLWFKGMVGHEISYLRNPQLPVDTWTVAIPNYSDPIKLMRFERNRIEVSIPEPILLSLLEGTTPSVIKQEFAIAVVNDYLLLSVAKPHLNQPPTPEQLMSTETATNAMRTQPTSVGDVNPERNQSPPYITFQATENLTQALIPIEIFNAFDHWHAGSGWAGIRSNHNGQFELAYEYKLQIEVANASMAITEKTPETDELQQRIANLPEPIKEALYTEQELDRFMLGLGLMYKAIEADALKQFQRIAIQNSWIDELLDLQDHPEAFQERLARARYWIIEQDTWLTIKSPKATDATLFDLIVKELPFNQAVELGQAHCPDSYFPEQYQILDNNISIYAYELNCERLKFVFTELHQHQQNDADKLGDS